MKVFIFFLLLIGLLLFAWREALQTKECPDCRGTGKVEVYQRITCRYCEGSGKKFWDIDGRHKAIARNMAHNPPCNYCQGVGWLQASAGQTCLSCGGQGNKTLWQLYRERHP